MVVMEMPMIIDLGMSLGKQYKTVIKNSLSRTPKRTPSLRKGTPRRYEKEPWGYEKEHHKGYEEEHHKG